MARNKIVVKKSSKGQKDSLIFRFLKDHKTWSLYYPLLITLIYLAYISYNFFYYRPIFLLYDYTFYNLAGYFFSSLILIVSIVPSYILTGIGVPSRLLLQQGWYINGPNLYGIIFSVIFYLSYIYFIFKLKSLKKNHVKWLSITWIVLGIISIIGLTSTFN